jgi:hypothetical protein
MIQKKTKKNKEKKKKKKLIFVKSIFTEDDFKVIPEEIHEKICKVILEKLQPAILNYMKTFKNFTIRGLTVEHISYEDLSSYHGSLEPAFKIQHQYDLYLMKRNLGETGAKWTGFFLFGHIFLTATRNKNFFAQRDPPLSLLFFSIKTPAV